MFKMNSNRKFFKPATTWQFINEHGTESITMFHDGSLAIRYFARYKQFDNIESLIRALAQSNRKPW